MARAGGFSLHAGVDIAPNERANLERLCRYVSRPPVAGERLALTAAGQMRYTLKTPYRDGTTHIVLEPLDLMERLAALVPAPRMHLTRDHGVLAPHSQYRAAVTPAHRGLGAVMPPVAGADPTKPSTPRPVAMSWARRLKRVFGVEIEGCARFGGRVRGPVGVRSFRIQRGAEWAACGWSGPLAWRPGNGRGPCAEAHGAPRSPRQGARPLSLGATNGWLRASVVGSLASGGSLEIPIRHLRRRLCALIAIQGRIHPTGGHLQ